jgi:hypothetical protein
MGCWKVHRTLPHKVNVFGLIQQLNDVGAFVDHDHQPQFFILQDEGSVSLINDFTAATSVIAVVVIKVVIGLLAHHGLSKNLIG